MTEHVALRLDEATLARIDALIPRFSTPWHKATRSEVIRALVASGLDAAEALDAEDAAPRSGRQSATM